MTLEEEWDDLRRQLRGTQEMLAMVLATVGEPVTVTKKMIDLGLPDGIGIVVEEDVQDECFIFYLESQESNDA